MRSAFWTTAALTLLLTSLVACGSGGASDPVCGDGNLEYGEDVFRRGLREYYDARELSL